MQNHPPVAAAATGLLDCTIRLIPEEKEGEEEDGGALANGGMRTAADGVGPGGGGSGTPSGPEWTRPRMGSPPTARRADAAAALADAVAELLLGRVRMPAAATKTMMTAAVRDGEGEEDHDGDNGAGGGRRRSAPATHVPPLTYLHLPGGVLLLTLSLVMTRTPPHGQIRVGRPPLFPPYVPIRPLLPGAHQSPPDGEGSIKRV